MLHRRAIKENPPGELVAGPKMTGRSSGASRLRGTDVFLAPQPGFYGLQKRKGCFRGGSVVLSLLISIPDPEGAGTRSGGQAAAGNHMG